MFVLDHAILGLMLQTLLIKPIIKFVNKSYYVKNTKKLNVTRWKIF